MPTERPHPYTEKRDHISAILCALCAFSCGSSIGWTANGSQEVLLENAYSFTPSPKQWSWINALIMMGAAFSGIPIALVVSSYGCRYIMLVIMVPYIVGWMLHIFSITLYSLYLGRFLLGICGGMVAVAVPVYTIEIGDMRCRGKMGCLYYLCLNLGIIGSYVMGALFKVKVVNILNLLLSIIFCLVAFKFMHEWPTFRGSIISTNTIKSLGHQQEANLTTDNQYTVREYIQYLKKRRTLQRALAMAIILQILQQLCGGLVITVYWITIFEFTSNASIPFNLTILMPLCNIICSIACFCVVDRIGRIPILLISASCMSAASFILAVCFQVKGKHLSSWVVLAALCIFISANAFALGPVVVLITAEIFPSNVRVYSFAIAATCNWTVSAIMVLWYLSSIIRYGPSKIFWFTTAMGIITIFFVYLFFPETKDRDIFEKQKKLSKDRDANSDSNIETA